MKSYSESERINRMIHQDGMRETVISIMKEKGMDCPQAKRYINENR